MAYNVIGQVQSTVPPTVTDDSSKGFAIGSQWVDSAGQNTYTCYSAAVGAAVWLPLGTGVGVLDPLQVVTFAPGFQTFVVGTAWA